jgi:hypothetical protein
MKKILITLCILVGSNAWGQNFFGGQEYENYLDRQDELFSLVQGSDEEIIPYHLANRHEILPEKVLLRDQESSDWAKLTPEMFKIEPIPSKVMQSALNFINNKQSIFQKDGSTIEDFHNAGLDFNESLDSDGNTFLILLVKNHKDKKNIIEITAQVLMHGGNPIHTNKNGESATSIASDDFFDSVLDFMNNNASGK